MHKEMSSYGFASYVRKFYTKVDNDQKPYKYMCTFLHIANLTGGERAER